MKTSSHCEYEFTIVIPCFNEEKAISETITHLYKAIHPVERFEIVIVNDGSTDRITDILTDISLKFPSLTVINHDRNRGYGAALKTGIRSAKAEIIAITDSDGTYPNERIPELVDLVKGRDMVVGSRTSEDVEYPLIRKIPKVFLRNYASWLIGVDIPDMNSGLRVFRKSLAKKFFKILPDGFSFTTTITMASMRSSYNVLFVPISYRSRIGKSKIRPIQDTLHFIQLILRTGMYFAPLRVLSPMIFLLALGFLVSATYDIFVLSNFTDKTVLLFLFMLNTIMFALLADMIDKRSLN